MLPKSTRILLLVVLAACLAAACDAGPRRVRGEPPQIGIDNLTRDDGAVIIELSLRNVNDRPLDIESVTLDMQLDQQPFTHGRQKVSVQVAPRSREVLRIRLAAQAAGLERLDELAASGRAGVRWQMNLTWSDSRGRAESRESSGWLHPVPGQPGRFR